MENADASGCAFIHYSTIGENGPYTAISVTDAKTVGIPLNRDTSLHYYAEDVLGNISLLTVATTEQYVFQIQ